MTPAIEVANLTKKYGETVAVENLSLTVPAGTMFGFLGPNGSGKSTTIGCLTGLLDPTAGSIRILGEPCRVPGSVGALLTGADAVAVTADAESARAAVLAFTGGEGVDHAVDYTGSPDLLRFIGSVMRLGGSLVVSSEQGREPLPFTASDMIRLELNLLGMRGARMNDMITVLKLLGTGQIKTRVAARFPLAKVGDAHELLVNSPDLVGQIVVLPWA